MYFARLLLLEIFDSNCNYAIYTMNYSIIKLERTVKAVYDTPLILCTI